MASSPQWTVTPERPGYRSKTIKRGKVTVVVHRPELSDKERTKREQYAETALSHYAKNTVHRRKETNV